MKFYIKKIISSILKFNQVNKIQAILILLLIVFYAYLIYALPLFQWDESRLGVNAIEMLKSHHYLAPTYLGEPDYWNTKPPFAIWSMCTSIFLFGLSVFTLRLPAVLFAIGSILFVLWLVKRERLASAKMSLFYIFILATAIGFSGFHIAISADYDAIFLFFFTITALSACFSVIYAETAIKKSKQYFLVAILTFTLGFLTKGIAICFVLPAILLFALINKKVKILLSRQYLYLLIPVLAIVAYYLLRNHISPGYIKAVYHNEFARYAVVQENHSESFWFYFEGLFTGRFSYWIYLILLTPLVLKPGNFVQPITKQVTIFNIIAIFSYLLIISAANTKLQWYDAAIYPIIALQILINIDFIYSYTVNKSARVSFLVFCVLLSMASSFRLGAYFNNLLEIKKWPNERESILLDRFMRSEPQEVNFIKFGYFGHLDCYRLILENNGVGFNLLTYEGIKADSNRILLTSDNITIAQLKKFYQITSISHDYFGMIFKINRIDPLKVKQQIRIEAYKVAQNKAWQKHIQEKAILNHFTYQKQLLSDLVYVDSLGPKKYNSEIRKYLLSQ